MDLPTIGVIAAAVRDDANRVWEAMGRGPGTFSVPLATVPGKTVDTYSPDFYLFADSSAQDYHVAAWHAMQNGDLPPVAPGVVWGENGVIGAAEAMAAVTGANLQIYSASGDVAPYQHMVGILQGRGLYLMTSEG